MGLRNAVLLVLGFGVALGIGLAVTHCPHPWIVMAVYCALGIGAILIERGRYRPKLTGLNFVPTPERFADPVTGQLVQVYVDEATGQRDYRPLQNGQ